MKVTIVTTVLLGLLLTPALADTDWNTEGNQHSDKNDQYINEQFVKNQMPTKQIIRGQIIRKQINVNGRYQTLTLERQRRIVTIQQVGTQRSWKTIWNYNSGAVATKVLPERVCYISKVNRMELPRFDELFTLAEESMSLKGQVQQAREVTFVIERRVRDLRSYGQDIFALCRGLPTYVAYEVHGPQYQYNQGSCLALNVLQVLDLQYCHEFDQNVKQDLVSN